MPGSRLALRLDQRHAVVVATSVSAVLHVLMAASLPLIITPDGGEYIRGALALGNPGEPWIELNRTPGFHVLLYLTFRLFGVGAGGVLVVLNVLATASCALLTWTACRVAGPRIGLVIGLLYAIEPWSLALGNYALTETPTVFFVVLAATLVLGVRRASVPVAIGVGAALAVACLMRPAVQVMIPFFGLAWILGLPVAPRRRAALGAVVVATFVALCAPWLAYNASRGVRGFAGTSGTMMWYGVALAGLLDPAHPIDTRTREAFDRHLSAGIGDWPVHQVIYATDALRSLEQDALLGEWARASIKKEPLRYLVGAWHALLWQLDVGITGKPPFYDEMPFLLQRLTWDTHQPPRGPAPNFQNAGTWPRWQAFAMAWHGGIAQTYIGWAAHAWPRGVPHVPLVAATMVACVLALARREWPLALVLAATLAFLAFHAALLMPITRHVLPAMTLWYLGLAALLRDLARLSRRSTTNA